MEDSNVSSRLRRRTRSMADVIDPAPIAEPAARGRSAKTRGGLAALGSIRKKPSRSGKTPASPEPVQEQAKVGRRKGNSAKTKRRKGVVLETGDDVPIADQISDTLVTRGRAGSMNAQ